MWTKATLIIGLSLAGMLAVASSALSANFRSQRFGSIAYSHSTGRFGSSWNFTNAADAEEQALASCNRADCRTVVWFRNGCGALARARNGAIITAWSDTATDARRLASNRCTREWGSCKLICSVCSGGNEP